MPKVVCVWRGSDEIDNAIAHLDETRVQLLYTKFPVGSGTFKRNKYIYVQYIGPRCSVVKRGQGISYITDFTTKTICGVPGFSTTDKAALSFESLVQHMRHTFVTDNGTFSMEQIRREYRERLAAEQESMHHEQRQAGTVARARSTSTPKARLASKSVTSPPRQRPAPPPTPPAPVEVPPQNNAEIVEQTHRVVTSLRQDHGSVNWVIFQPNPAQLTIHAYGRQGIFEMVKNLPDELWLFGLFRISFSNGTERQHRMIFFQWIGSRLPTVRRSGSIGVYPAMAKALYPFHYEIYLVGRQDLNPKAIIDKSRNAFRPSAKDRSEVMKDFVLDSSVFTEDNYRQSLVEEQSKAMAVEETPGKPSKNRGPATPTITGQEAAFPSVAATDAANTQRNDFPIEETISLVQAEEGGLVWAIFEVQ